jgi:hypothetical protein
MRSTICSVPFLAIIRFIKNKFHTSSRYRTENRWVILLGVLVLIPFISVSLLGIHSYNILESTRDIERLERSRIEIKLFQQHLTKQVTTLAQYFHEIVLAAYSDNGTDGIRHLANNDPLFLLIAPLSYDALMLTNAGQTISHVEESILKDTLAERVWAKKYLLDQNVDRVWSPVRSIFGNAYLHCWQQNSENGFCVFMPTEEVHKRLWQSELLQNVNQNIHIQDSFMQTIGTHHSGMKQSSTMINIDGLLFNLSFSLEEIESESVSEYWLILAILLPLLGLAIAIAWMIFLSHTKQIKTTNKLLHGTQEIAHELRTPLSNINLYIGLILHKYSTVEQLKYGDIITQEMQRITRIIDNAIELMRDKQPEQYEYGNPLNLLNEMANQYRLLMAKSGCELTVECTITLSYFYPKHAVEHILLNLLNNAKKYAPGEQVVLGLNCENNRLFFWVKNYRTNVQNSDCNKVYLKQSSGLGLGLMSCKRLSVSLGGGFDCKINKNGRCYTAYFPLKEEKIQC